MKDYSECIINIKEFVRRAEDCFNAKNPIGAQKFAEDVMRESVDLIEIAKEMAK